MSTTTKTSATQGVNLGPASSLEEYLGGLESPQYSPMELKKRSDLEKKIADLESGKTSKSIFGKNANESLIAKYKQDLYDIEQESLKKRTGGLLDEGLRKLAGMGAQGAPTGLFNEGQAAGKDLAGMLQEYQRTGGLPGEQDVKQAGGLANQLFSARRTALQQSLEDQSTAFAREQGRRGLMTNDPVFNAKLRTGFMRQQDLLGAEQQAQSTQIAMGLPGQRLGFAAQRADTLSSLADRENARYQQGLANLSALLGVGQGMLQGEQNWRYTTADKWSKSKNTESGFGPAMSAISAPIAAAGSIMQGISSLGQGTDFSKAAQPSGGSFGGFGGQSLSPAQSFNLQGNRQGFNFGLGG